MKNMIKVGVVGAFMALGLVQSNAGIVFTNEIAYNVTVALTGFGQGATEGTVDPVKLATKDLIQVLGAATANTFSAKAKLVALAHPGGGGGPTLVVRETTGNTNVDVDVSGLLSVSIPASVSKVAASGKTGTDYVLLNLTLAANSTGVDFNVQGAGMAQRGPITSKGAIIENLGTKSVNAQVSGEGHLKNKAGAVEHAIIKGTVVASGAKVEPIP